MSSIRTYEITHSEQKPLPIKQKDTTDYLLGGSLGMKNGKIDKVLFDGGYAQATAVNKTTKDKFAFYYYNQDHLGNNREVVDAKGNVTQVTNYYPFGAPYADATAIMGAAVQPYKYNGKELDLMHGLNTYDYGARQYNPVTARWDRIDPLCEKYYPYSPYNYCVNNPVKFIDPDGREIQLYGRKGERILNYINSLSSQQYRIDKNGRLALTNKVIKDGNHSIIYSDKINAAIKSNNLIVMKVGNWVNDEQDKIRSIDDYYGGVTRKVKNTETGETYITITIADKTEEDGGGAYYVKDEFGNDMEMSMEWIVLHELIGHGIPYLETLAHKNREKRNAVENENEVRSELNETYRQEDEDHVE